MTEFPANALPAREGPLSSPPTTDVSWRARRAGLAEPIIEDHAMSTSDLKIMKELEASFLTAIDTHEGIIHKICHAWSRNRADEENRFQHVDTHRYVLGVRFELNISWSKAKRPAVRRSQILCESKFIVKNKVMD